MDGKNLKENQRFLEYLKNAEFERKKKAPVKKTTIGITITVTELEADIIRHKTKRLKALKKMKRTDLLKKVLLNLDDEDLIYFLSLR